MTVEERIAQTVAELQRHGWTEREIEELIDRMVEQGRFELTAADDQGRDPGDEAVQQSHC